MWDQAITGMFGRTGKTGDKNAHDCNKARIVQNVGEKGDGMKLQAKSVLSNLTIGVLSIIALYGLVVIIWVKNYEQLEQNLVRDNVKRTQFIWNKEAAALKSVVGDWAPWDDLYEFARNPEVQDFVKSNLPDSSMVNLKVDVVAVTDPGGNIIFAKAIDMDKKEEMAVPASLKQHIQPGKAFLDSLDGEKSVNGVFWMDHQPVLVAAQRIYKSDKSGISPGILFFLRNVDKSLLQEFSDIVQVPMQIVTNQEYLSLADMQHGHESVISPDDAIRSFIPIPDLSGNAYFALVIDTPRTLYYELQQQLKSFIALFVILSAILALLATLNLRHMVIRRLEKLDGFLRQADIVDGDPKQLAIEGNDELTQVAKSVNELLERIARSRLEIVALNASLREELDERKRTEIVLQYSSQHDTLTGLHNRTYLESFLLRMTETGAQGVGVICCDLDGLKLINDTLGHAAGDDMLKRAAGILRSCAPESAAVVRTGGDEFLIVLCGIAESELDSIGQRIEKMCGTGKTKGLILQLSLGWQYSEFCPPNSEDLDNLIKAADDQMYRQKLSSSQSAHSAVVHTIMKMLEIRDFATEEHSQRLAKMTAGLSERIGLPGHRKNDLLLLAQFHDIGKIGVPDKILLKPGSFTLEERKEMERHPEIGHRIAMVIAELKPVANFILKHHEWWNGKGYPLGLQGEKIPMENRILAIVDAYDAMTTDRPYRKALTHANAVAELRKGQGTQFDPALVDEFLVMIETDSIYIPGEAPS